MNIFVISDNVSECAMVLDDRRLIKQCLETAQLISTCLSITDTSYYKIRYQLSKAYKPAYKNHPCSIWTRESYRNFWWLVDLGKAYCREYTYRFNKVHACEKVFTDMCEPKRDLPKNYVDCSNHKHVSDDVFINYQACLVDKWNADIRKPKWTKRTRPYWYV